MFSKCRLVFILVTLSFSLVFQPLAFAQSPDEPEPEEETSENQDEPEINRREASDLAQEAYTGRVVSIRLVEDEWRVRIDDEGTIFNVHVNSSTGKITRPD